MIYVLVPALALAVIGYGRIARTRGLLVFVDAAIATIGGLVAGLALGVGARIAMRVLAVALSLPLRLTADGTILVIAAFSCVGAVLGFIYVGALRDLLWRRGLLYGLLLSAVTFQPFLRTAAEDLQRPQLSPEVLLGTIGMSLAMWVPYGVLLEWSIDRMRSVYVSSGRYPFGHAPGIE